MAHVVGDVRVSSAGESLASAGCEAGGSPAAALLLVSAVARPGRSTARMNGVDGCRWLLSDVLGPRL